MNREFRTFVATAAVAFAALLLWVGPARAEVKPVVDHNDNDQATPAFKFKHVPAPSRTDAAAKAKVSIVDGERDANGADVDAVTDGKLPTERDQPAANFFFDAGTEGGRLLMDLGGGIDVKQVNTYSWHPDTRGPQVYTLYAADGKSDALRRRKVREGDGPRKTGWQRSRRWTRGPRQGEPGGQYGVSLADPDGTLGKYRYLLFDMQRTENDDPFGNTFYSEIDVIDPRRPRPERTPAAAAAAGATTRADGRRRQVRDHDRHDQRPGPDRVGRRDAPARLREVVPDHRRHAPQRRFRGAGEVLASASATT